VVTLWVSSGLYAKIVLTIYLTEGVSYT
jgi:hypothetical protein